MHHAEIGHLGDAAIFFRRCLPHRREHRHHRIIDPDIDAAAFARDRVGGLEHRIGIGDIRRNHERAAAKLFRFLLDLLKRRGIARDQGEIGAGFRKAQRDGAADAGGGAGDDDGPVMLIARCLVHDVDTNGCWHSPFVQRADYDEVPCPRPPVAALRFFILPYM